MNPESTDGAEHLGGCTDGPCNDVKKHLWEYVDGELDSQDCERIKNHIDRCPPCAQEFQQDRKVKDVVARACSCETAPQDLRGKVMAMVAQLRSEMCAKSAAAKVAREQQLADVPGPPMLDQRLAD